MRQEPAEHLVGAVGVHVHLEVGVHAHHQVAVAHRGQEVLGLVDVDRVGVDQKLGAVAERRALPVVDLLDLDLWLEPAREGELVAELAGFARQRRHERVEEDRQAETAGVDHVVLLEHRQQLGGALDRGERLLHHVLERLVAAELLLAGVLGGRGAVLEHGEDRALDRLAHRLEGDLDRAAERAVDARGVHLVGLGRALAQAAQDLGGDDAGVAARAHERAGGDGAADLGAVGADGQRRQVVDDRGKRQRHVGAGVAVGNGEHVEAVDLVLALVEHLARGGNGIDDVVDGI